MSGPQTENAVLIPRVGFGWVCWSILDGSHQVRSIVKTLRISLFIRSLKNPVNRLSVIVNFCCD